MRRNAGKEKRKSCDFSLSDEISDADADWMLMNE
jgi:hypothetical protein